jgi:hypothetical protein
MKHNSLLVIEYDANLSYRHGILADLSTDTDSYSIVFRNSITSRHNNYVFGINTPFKTYSDLSNFIKNPSEISKYFDKETQNKKLVELYKIENKTRINGTNIYNEIIDNCIF